MEKCRPCQCSLEDRLKRVLMVRRLHPAVSMQSLLQTFGAYGGITGCKVFTHKSGRSAGCASLEFASHQAACSAFRELQGTQLHGKDIHLQWFDHTLAASPCRTANQLAGGDIPTSPLAGGTAAHTVLWQCSTPHATPVQTAVHPLQSPFGLTRTPAHSGVAALAAAAQQQQQQQAAAAALLASGLHPMQRQLSAPLARSSGAYSQPPLAPLQMPQASLFDAALQALCSPGPFTADASSIGHLMASTPIAAATAARQLSGMQMMAEASSPLALALQQQSAPVTSQQQLQQQQVQQQQLAQLAIQQLALDSHQQQQFHPPLNPTDVLNQQHHALALAAALQTQQQQQQQEAQMQALLLQQQMLQQWQLPANTAQSEQMLLRAPSSRMSTLDGSALHSGSSSPSNLQPVAVMQPQVTTSPLLVHQPTTPSAQATASSSLDAVTQAAEGNDNTAAKDAADTTPAELRSTRTSKLTDRHAKKQLFKDDDDEQATRDHRPSPEDGGTDSVALSIGQIGAACSQYKQSTAATDVQSKLHPCPSAPIGDSSTEEFLHKTSSEASLNAQQQLLFAAAKTQQQLKPQRHSQQQQQQVQLRMQSRVPGQLQAVHADMGWQAGRAKAVRSSDSQISLGANQYNNSGVAPAIRLATPPLPQVQGHVNSPSIMPASGNAAGVYGVQNKQSSTQHILQLQQQHKQQQQPAVDATQANFKQQLQLHVPKFSQVHGPLTASHTTVAHSGFNQMMSADVLQEPGPAALLPMQHAVADGILSADAGLDSYASHNASAAATAHGSDWSSMAACLSPAQVSSLAGRFPDLLAAMVGAAAGNAGLQQQQQQLGLHATKIDNAGAASSLLGKTRHGSLCLDAHPGLMSSQLDFSSAAAAGTEQTGSSAATDGSTALSAISQWKQCLLRNEGTTGSFTFQPPALLVQHARAVCGGDSSNDAAGTVAGSDLISEPFKMPAFFTRSTQQQAAPSSMKSEGVVLGRRSCDSAADTPGVALAGRDASSVPQGNMHHSVSTPTFVEMETAGLHSLGLSGQQLQQQVQQPASSVGYADVLTSLWPPAALQQLS